MMRRKITLLLLFIAAFYVQANNFDTNKTAILAEDTNRDDPIKLRQAFAQILANNSGEDIAVILQNSVFASTDVKQGIKRAYFENIESKYLTSTSMYHYWFHLVLHESFIDSTIKQAGFSLLPKNREKVVLWLAFDETTENEQLPLNYAYNNDLIMYWTTHWANSLGLNSFIPKIDADDRNKVSPSSIKSLSYQANTQSSNRYGINQSLLMYFRLFEDSYKIRSGFASGSDLAINHFQKDSSDLGVALYSIMVNAANNYASQFKIAAHSLEKHTVQLVIKSLDNYDEVNTVSDYLTSLSVIESFDIISASYGQFVVTANLSITNNAFLQIITRDRVLIHDKIGSVNQLVFGFNNKN